MKNVILILLLFLAAGSFLPLHAQDCNAYTLTMPDDTTICETGVPLVLTPVFTGNIASVEWTPSAGLDFPTLINPTATVNTTTTYDLTIIAVAPENLIFNGDFSMGDVGFFSDYNYGNGGPFGVLSDEGDYAIDDNSGDTHSNFADCDDHTGGGNMMVINGSGQPDDVWCQNVSVQPNTAYNFSAWVATVISENPANLQFSINGILLGDQFDATLQTCNWQQFAETWFSGSNTTAQICVVNVNEETTGNDFALDDIAFSPVCTYTGSVTINVEEPPSAPVVMCEATTSSITLDWDDIPNADGYVVNVLNAPDGMLQGTSYILDGLSPGQMVDFEVIAINDQGCETSTLISCSTENCPVLDIDIQAPDAICEGASAEFVVSISGAGGPFEITINDGQNDLNFNIPAGTSSLAFLPSQTTTYEITAFTIVDAANCQVNSLPASFTIIVNTQPSAGIASDKEYCENENTEINLATLLEMADLGGLWSDVSITPAGSAFNPIDETLDISQLQEGNYQFEYLINAPQGCEDTSVVSNITIHNTPLADAGTDATLNCLVRSVEVGGVNTTISGSLNYEWSVIMGGSLVDNTLPLTQANLPGTYVLAVSDPLYNCSDTDTVIVTEQLSMPVLFASAEEGPCGISEGGIIRVDSVNNGLPPYQYSLDGSTPLASTIFNNLSSGNYILEVIDGNGCEGTLSLFLPEGNDLQTTLLSNGPSTIFAGESATITLDVNRAEEDIKSVEWFPQPENCDNCLSATVSPSQTQTYQVVVEDINGCVSTSSITIQVEQRSRYYIPTAFSPNDDGRNDLIYPYTGPEFLEVADFVIMDRWGNMVFRQQAFPPNDMNFAWDGNFKGEQAPVGVYAYFLVLNYSSGLPLTVSGEINLIR